MIKGFGISPFFRRGISHPPPAPFATIFENEFDSGDYTIIGNATATFNSGTSITISGAGGDLNDCIQYNGWVTSRDDLRQTLRFHVETYDGTSYGVGLKLRSVNNGATDNTRFNWSAILVTSNNGENGKIYIYRSDINGNEAALLTASASGFAVSLTDYLELNVTQLACGYSMTAYNLTKDSNRLAGSSLTFNYPLTYPFNTSVYHNTAKPCIVGFGGSHTVDYWKFYTNEYYNSDLLVVGDSKTIGFGCTSVNDRYGYLFASNNPGKYITTNGGGSDKTAEFLASLNELKSYRARKAILCIGRNDIANSISSAVWQANYQSIVSGLESVGTEVWHQLPLTETVLDQSALATWITGQYSNIIPVPPTWNSATDNVADGIHPNTAGHLKIYNNAANYITL